MSSLSVIVMAAGRGTRMNSELPKVLHRIDGKTMIDRVLDTASELKPNRIVVVVGYGRDLITQQLQGRDCRFVIQDPPLGTGHAVAVTEAEINNGQLSDVVVLSGDVPLLRGDTVKLLIQKHKSSEAAGTVLTSEAPGPSGYGRIVRSGSGELERIVEQRDATAEEQLISEVNSGVYAFKVSELFSALRHIGSDNAKGEYYLTDAIGVLRTMGLKVRAEKIAEFREICGINTVAELAEAERHFIADRSTGVQLDKVALNS